MSIARASGSSFSPDSFCSYTARERVSWGELRVPGLMLRHGGTQMTACIVGGKISSLFRM